jgi:hypothetical protein
VVDVVMLRQQKVCVFVVKCVYPGGVPRVQLSIPGPIPSDTRTHDPRGLSEPTTHAGCQNPRHTLAARAAKARGRGTGNRGSRSRRGRGARGRATTAAGGNVGVDDSDSDLELIGMSESSESNSDSDTESEAEIPIPRSWRQRPVQVIQGRYEGTED